MPGGASGRRKREDDLPLADGDAPQLHRPHVRDLETSPGEQPLQHDSQQIDLETSGTGGGEKRRAHSHRLRGEALEQLRGAQRPRAVEPQVVGERQQLATLRQQPDLGGEGTRHALLSPQLEKAGAGKELQPGESQRGIAQPFEKPALEQLGVDGHLELAQGAALIAKLLRSPGDIEGEANVGDLHGELPRHHALAERTPGGRDESPPLAEAELEPQGKALLALFLASRKLGILSAWHGRPGPMLTLEGDPTKMPARLPSDAGQACGTAPCRNGWSKPS